MIKMAKILNFWPKFLTFGFSVPNSVYSSKMFIISSKNKITHQFIASRIYETTHVLKLQAH